jgi:glutathione S-transferase
MPDVSETLANNIRRVVAVWMETRARFGHSGPLLFGTFTNADAMYAPVATRFRTYGVPLTEFGDDGTAATYVDAVYAMPDMAAWLAGAEAEMRASALV